MSESLESLALEAAGNVDDGKAVSGLSELLRALACVCRERDELAAWKESAITVWPPSQEIARAIGVQLGESVHDKILPLIKQANSDRNSLRSELDALRHDLEAAKTDPEKHSCIPLYAAPQPTLEVERLTDEAIAAEVERRWDTHSEPLTFGAGARWARDYCNSAWGLKLKEQR